MEDHDFHVVRKNLNILSVVILLLAFSHAEINKFNFLGMDVSLEGSKFYIGLFVLYLYFIWRYWTKANIRGEFYNSFEKYFLESEEGVKRKYSLERMLPLARKQYSEAFTRIDADEKANIVSHQVSRRIPYQLRELIFILAYYVTPIEKGEHANKHFHVDFSVSRSFILRKLISYSLRHDKFGDYIFPFIPVSANVAFFLFAAEWQGGMRQLFSFP